MYLFTGFAQEPQAEFAKGSLLSFVRPNQSSLAVLDPKPAPQAEKKKKGKIKATDAGLEGFVKWVDSIASDSAEEREDDLSNLAARFALRMFKQATSAQGDTTPGSEVSGEKCFT